MDLPSAHRLPVQPDQHFCPSCTDRLIRHRRLQAMNNVAHAFALTVLFFRAAFAADPALTIYNQNFAVVRDTVPLKLKQGINEVRFTETTAQLEPDSVILRDPSGKVKLTILEQNYRNDPLSQE